MPEASRSSPAPRVFVTGLAGFTGRYLGQRLVEAGFALCRSQSGDEQLYNLTDRDSLDRLLQIERPDYVVHLAGISFVPHADPTELYRVNTVGSLSLLEALVHSRLKLRKVILASSANVYGNCVDDPITEDSTLAPINHYGCSKCSMEHMARGFFDRLPIVIVRPFNYTGVGQPGDFLIPKLVRHFASRAAHVELGNINVIRDFSDVRMAADAYCRLLASPISGDVLNMCSGVGYSMKWVLHQLTFLSGHTLEVRTNRDLIRSNELSRLVGSANRLIETIGPLRFTNFEATLKWMLSAYADGKSDASVSALEPLPGSPS